MKLKILYYKDQENYHLCLDESGKERRIWFQGLRFDRYCLNNKEVTVEAIRPLIEIAEGVRLVD